MSTAVQLTATVTTLTSLGELTGFSSMTIRWVLTVITDLDILAMGNKSVYVGGTIGIGIALTARL